MARKKYTRTEPHVDQVTILEHEVDSIYIDTQSGLVSYTRIDLDPVGNEVGFVARIDEEVVQSDFANAGDWNQYKNAFDDFQEMLMKREQNLGSIGAGTISSALPGSGTLSSPGNGKNK